MKRMLALLLMLCLSATVLVGFVKHDPSAEAGAEDWALLLVNAQNPLPVGDTPLLEEVQGIYRMDARVAPAMQQMLSDAKQQGVALLVCSAYRPYERQKLNFDRKVNDYRAAGYSAEKAVEATSRYIALPGTSEHETGLAADIVTPDYQLLDAGYAETDAAKWLVKNAAQYGFILRYPQDKTELTGIAWEPWHYRYVGKQAAEKIMEKGICLEEYLTGDGKTGQNGVCK